MIDSIKSKTVLNLDYLQIKGISDTKSSRRGDNVCWLYFFLQNNIPKIQQVTQAKTSKKYIGCFDYNAVAFIIEMHNWEMHYIYTKTPLQALWVAWLMVFITTGFTVHNCAGVDMMVFLLS